MRKTQISETYIAFDNIVAVRRDVPGKSKVTDLGHPAFGEQNVPGCQVSVDTLRGT